MQLNYLHICLVLLSKLVRTEASSCHYTNS